MLHTSEVPSDKGLRVSSPILTNDLAPGQVPRLRLRLDRRYSRGAALDRVSGKPRVSASFAIVRASQVIQENAASPIEPTRDGQLLRLLGFGLDGLAAGDYTLVLKVVDEVSGQSLELREPLAIVTGSG